MSRVHVRDRGKAAGPAPGAISMDSDASPPALMHMSAIMATHLIYRPYSIRILYIASDASPPARRGRGVRSGHGVREMETKVVV
jgi:hypothetical protein